MLSTEEYHAKCKLLGELMLDDPEPLSDLGRELLALADEIEDYEREHFPDMFKRTCDFCGKVCDPHEIDCEEGDQWACFECDDRWAKEDGGVRKY
jgi:hypothetical protein